MKKFFTLIAVALVAVGANAQDAEYTDLGEQVTNGEIVYKRTACKSGDFSKYPADQLVNFVSGEWVTGEKTQGTARVVVDPAQLAAWEADEEGRNNINYCIEVVTRDDPKELDLDDEGNPKLDDQGNPKYKTLNGWDSRFFVVLPITLHEGDKVTFSMDVKAEKAVSGIGAQAHTAPDAYKDWRVLNDLAFGTLEEGWKNYAKDVTISANQDGMTTFAFDLGYGANKMYFDNISVKVQQKKLPDDYIDMSKIDWDNVNWINLVDNGNCAAETSYSLVCRESGKADAFNRVLGCGNNETYGVQITSVNNAANPWDTQFFIYVKHEFRSGEKLKVAFDYRSDDPATIPTQTHSTPGNYLAGGEGMVGSLSSTTEWQHYEKVVNAVKGMSTLTFNLNNDKTLATNFYFDNVEMCIAEEVASAEEKQEAANIIAAKVEDTVATRINTAAKANAAKTIFNVAGQQMKSLQKGLNIVNGEKIYVK